MNWIPKSWETTIIPEMISKDGVFSDGDWIESKDQNPNGNVRLIQLADIGNGKYLDKSSRFLTLEKAKELNCTFIQKGDILVARLAEPLGRACIFPGDSKISVTAVDVCIIRFGENRINHEWLISVLNSPKIRKTVENLSSGTTRKRISRRNLATIQIPLPPLNEQKRIVAKIEALQTRSTAVKKELEAIKPLLDQFRQSVLAAAFRGDLTKDWREQNPDVESTEVLLERIRVERRRRWEEAELEKMKAKGNVPKDDKWKKRYKEPLPIDIDPDYLLDLPDEWLWLSADECSYLITDGEHATPKRSDKGVYLLSARNILNGEISYKKVDYVPEDVYKQLEQRLKLNAGDVLMSCSGTVGRSCIAPPDLKCAFVRSVAILKTVFETGEYISLAIRSPLLQIQIEKKKTQTAQSNIFQGRIKILGIPFAPFKEQKEIVRRIESLFKLADNIEQQYQQAEADLEALNQSILAKAFRGELVLQDPDDEPASVLLERIKAEREKAKPKKSKSKKQDKQLDIPGI